MRWRRALGLLALCALAVGSPASSLAQATWSDRLVDGVPELALPDSAVQIDASGRPHVFVGGDRVYHYWRDGDTWRNEVVDAAPRSGEDLHAAVGPSGEFHLVYVRNQKPDPTVPGPTRVFRYATNLSGEWVVATLTEPPDLRLLAPIPTVMAGLAVDASHRPHVLATRDHAAYHGLLDSGQWSYERLDVASGFGTGGPAGTYGYSSGLALDPAGEPHVIWTPDDGSWAVIHSWHSATGWSHEAVPQALHNPQDPSAILVDPSGAVHVLLKESLVLNHRSRPAGSSVWANETLANNPEAFAATLKGTHLQVLAVTRVQLLLKWEVDRLEQGDAGWTQTSVLPDVPQNLRVALAVEPNGDVDGATLPASNQAVEPDAPLTVVHGDAGWTSTEIARAATCDCGPLTRTLVDEGADVRLGLAGSQRRLLYRDGESDSTFAHARHATEDPNGFEVETLPVDPNHPLVVPQSLALAVAPDGEERAVWNAWTVLSQSVRPPGGSWTTTVQSPGEILLRSRRPALLRSGGFYALYAAMTSGGPQSLFLASPDASIPLDGPILPLDDPTYAPTRPLAIAGDLRNLHVAWVADDGSVLHATNASGPWVTETVTPFASATLGSHSIAVEPDGTVHLAYVDDNNGIDQHPGLRYGTNRCPGGWYVTDLDLRAPAAGPLTAPGASSPDLTLDPIGNPHVAYRSNVDHSLAHAYIRNGVWAVETAVPDTTSGDATAIAVDDAGVVSIAHHDSWAGELRLATRAPLAPEPKWNGCPPLPDPNAPPDGTFFFAPPPTSDGIYLPTGRVQISVGPLRAHLDVSPFISGFLELDNGFADFNGDSIIDSQLIGAGKLSRRRGEIRVVEVTRLVDSEKGDAVAVPKLAVLRAELIDLATLHREVLEEASGRMNGKKVRFDQESADDVPLSAFAMRLSLEIHPTKKGGLVASGEWPLGDGVYALLDGTGKWFPETSSFDLHLKGSARIDLRIHGMKLWQHHTDGVYLSAESLAAKALGQNVKLDLTGAF